MPRWIALCIFLFSAALLAQTPVPMSPSLGLPPMCVQSVWVMPPPLGTAMPMLIVSTSGVLNSIRPFPCIGGR